MHKDLQNKITQLEQQLAWEVTVDMEELKQKLEDVQEQLKVIGNERNEYWNQVERVLDFAVKDGNLGSRGHNGSMILRFSEADRGALRRWMAQLAMKIADEPGHFFNEQSKMRYATYQLERIALNQI
jgi:hypothetical protein